MAFVYSEDVRALFAMQSCTTVQGVREMHTKLEEIIGILLNEFTAQSGLKVNSLGLDHIETTAMGESKRTIAYVVKADVKL
jgi:hypothetical protein